MTRLEEQYGERFSDNMKIAILVSMLPEEVRDKVYELERGEGEVKYIMAKEVAV